MKHIRMQGIRKTFGATLALNGVDLDIKPGEIHALVGENGAGKSTLMRILSGTIQPDEGSMEIEGATYCPRDPREARIRGVAMVHQELSLAPNLTVAENVLLGSEPRKGWLMDQNELRNKSQAALSGIGRPDITLNALARDLNPAEQQLVEIARSVALGCKIFILDEPTSSLDKEDTDKLFNLLQGLKAEGISVIYITHALEEVEALADKCTVLRDGRVTGEITGIDFDAEKVVALMAGRDIKNPYPKSARVQGEPLLEINNLASSPLLKRASLSVHRGEIVGIAGLVGSGRTALLRTLFGLDPLAKGEIKINGHESPNLPCARWESGIGFLSESRSTEGLAQNLSVAQNICLPGLSRLTRNGVLAENTIEQEAETWIKSLGIRCDSPSQEVAQLSGGNQQKVALARLLFMGVDLLFLDEPTRGIDVGAKQGIYEWINRLTKHADPNQKPCGILMVSSYLPELLGICDRIAVMRDGILGPALPASSLSEHSILMEATGVSAA